MNYSISSHFCTQCACTDKPLTRTAQWGKYAWLLDASVTQAEVDFEQVNAFLDNLNEQLKSVCAQRGPKEGPRTLLMEVEKRLQHQLSLSNEKPTAKQINLTAQCSIQLVRIELPVMQYALLGNGYLLLKQGEDIQVLTDNRFEDFYASQAQELSKTLKAKNKGSSYFILDGIANSAKHALEGKVQILDPAQFELWLCSQGAARLWDLFEKPLTEVFAQGLSKNISELRELEKADAQCTKHPRYSLHGDATFLRLISENCEPRRANLNWAI